MLLSSADDRSLLRYVKVVLDNLRKSTLKGTFLNVVRHVLEFLRCISIVTITDVI